MDSTYVMILNNKKIPPSIHLHIGIFVEVLWRDLGCFKICRVGLGSRRHHRTWFVVRIYHPETREKFQSSFKYQEILKGRSHGATVCFRFYYRQTFWDTRKDEHSHSAAHLKQQNRFPGSHSCLTVLEKGTAVWMNCRGCMYSYQWGVSTSSLQFG